MPKGYVTFSQIGRYGRFGNCLFEAAFLRCYANRHELEAQAPGFPGQEVFGFHFPPVTVHLPPAFDKYRDQRGPHGEQLPPNGSEWAGCDIRAYCQFHTSWYAPHHDDLLAMFRPTERPTLAPGTSIGIHYRAGDYNNKAIFWRPPISWYMEWLDLNWPCFHNPTLYIAAEDPAIVDRFAAFRPQTARDMGMAGTFTDDWRMLNACDMVVMPNSTFSFTAAWLNPQLKEAWRANLLVGGFGKIDPWNTTPLRYERIEDHPEIRSTLQQT